MELNSLVAFGVTFVVGPVLCAVLLRLPAGLRTMATIGVALVAAIWAAHHFQTSSANGAVEALAAMWLAWVLGVSMVGLALLHRIDHPRVRRGITLTAILATTLPWFGLATAQMMA